VVGGKEPKRCGSFAGKKKSLISSQFFSTVPRGSLGGRAGSRQKRKKVIGHQHLKRSQLFEATHLQTPLGRKCPPGTGSWVIQFGPYLIGTRGQEKGKKRKEKYRPSKEPCGQIKEHCTSNTLLGWNVFFQTTEKFLSQESRGSNLLEKGNVPSHPLPPGKQERRLQGCFTAPHWQGGGGGVECL